MDKGMLAVTLGVVGPPTIDIVPTLSTSYMVTNSSPAEDAVMVPGLLPDPDGPADDPLCRSKSPAPENAWTHMTAAIPVPVRVNVCPDPTIGLWHLNRTEVLLVPCLVSWVQVFPFESVGAEVNPAAAVTPMHIRVAPVVFAGEVVNVFRPAPAVESTSAMAISGFPPS